MCTLPSIFYNCVVGVPSDHEFNFLHYYTQQCQWGWPAIASSAFSDCVVVMLGCKKGPWHQEVQQKKKKGEKKQEEKKPKEDEKMMVFLGTY